MGKNQKNEDIVFVAVTGNIPILCPKSFKSSSKVIRLENGMYTNTSKYIRVIIHGNYLSHRKIYFSEEWLVDPKSKAKIGDIVLIKKQDIHVLREIETISSDGRIIVSWKDFDGNETKELYDSKDIKGVLKYFII